MKLIPLLPLLLAPVFFLAACSDDTPPLILGPQKAYIVPQLQEEFQFLPGRTDAGAEITDARITGVGGKVVLNPDTQKLVLTFQAGFAATNGPANHGAPVTLTYFVTVSEGEDIISKDEYNITLHFDGHNNVAVGTSPPITLKFPNERDDPPAEVLVGLQMTDEQAAYTATHVAMP
jgi:hypothetical protein